MHPALGIGLGVGLVYAAFAAFVIASDRRPHGGGWISLAGLVSYLVTFPIAWLAEKLGHRLDHRRNLDMLIAVLGTGVTARDLLRGIRQRETSFRSRARRSGRTVSSFIAGLAAFKPRGLCGRFRCVAMQRLRALTGRSPGHVPVPSLAHGR